MRDAIAAAASPSTTHQSTASGSNLNVLVSPPHSNSKSHELAVSALSSCGDGQGAFEYQLDSVKLTPAQNGQPQQRHNTSAHLHAINVARQQQHQQLTSMTSPTACARSPTSTASPTHPIQVNLSPILIPKDR
jgi:hypothetical protein